MRKIVYLLFATPLFINAQAVCHDDSNAAEAVKISDVSGNTSGVNVNQTTYTNRDSSIKGSPFAFNDWSQGIITTSDNLAVKYDRIQFDLERNQVLVYANGSQFPSTLQANQILSFSANDTKENRKFVMIPASEFNDAQFDKLYETFSTTNNHLIKETTKSVKKANDDSGEMYYKKKTTYYIKDNSGKYVQTKLSKKQLIKKMKDHEKEVTQYIKKNKLSYKEEDVAKILDYYHSLTLVAKQ